MNRKVLYPILILLVGVAGAFILYITRDAVDTHPPEIPLPLVRTAQVMPQTTQLTVSTQGTVAPRTESTLVAQIPGEIQSVSPAFASGGFFEAGDLLLAIDPRDYEVAASQAQVQVAQAKLRLAREREEAAIAQEEWKRLGKGAPTDLVLRKPQIAEAEAALQAAESGLARAHLNLERTRIRAPYAGRVRTKNADIGQYVGPGTPLGRIYAIDYAEVRLPVPDAQLAFLDLDFGFRGETANAQGPEVRLQANFAGKEHTWLGHIVRVEGEVDARSRMVHLVARVENPYGRTESTERPPLAVGLFVRAEILGRTATDVYVLPRAALRGTDQLLVITEGRMFFRDVEVLRTTHEQVIIANGVNPGETVCLSPLDTVVDGMRIRTVPESDALTARIGDAP